MENIMLITRDEVLMGRDKEYPLTPELSINLDKLLEALNKFRQIYGKPMRVTSGYRPGKYNKAAGGASNSSHLTCEACDFADVDWSLKQFVMLNPQVLEDCGLYMEHPDHTRTWCHLQIRKTSSGVRIFKP